MKKHIPNLFTLGNLLCGCLACISVLMFRNLEIAAYLVLAGAFLDFFDGFAARLLNVSGELGKQLDSLADMVTFGVVPGLMTFMYCFLKGDTSVGAGPNYLVFVPLIIVLMSAMRLAKFNISTEQSDSFIGIPTPANTLFWIGIPVLLDYFDFFNLYLVVILSIVFSILMVVNYKMIALKFKSYGWAGNEARWVLIGTSIATLITLTTITGNVLASLPIIIILYIIISVINNSFSKHEL